MLRPQHTSSTPLIKRDIPAYKYFTEEPGRYPQSHSNIMQTALKPRALGESSEFKVKPQGTSKFMHRKNQRSFDNFQAIWHSRVDSQPFRDTNQSKIKEFKSRINPQLRTKNQKFLAAIMMN